MPASQAALTGIGESRAEGDSDTERGAISRITTRIFHGCASMQWGNVNGIGQRIRDARSQRGWSQNELASRAGVKQPTLQRIEAGLRMDPSIRTIAALAVALDMTIDALLDLPKNPLPRPEAGRPPFAAIEELTRHVSDLENQLTMRLHQLEDSIERRKFKRAT
jgi:transcriptional regulator with XRE-family HTH domain